MLGLPLAFAAPAVLFGLVALPVIWWLLRLTPPKPRSEIFPPLRILARVLKKEETPAQSPWWLTLLRLAMAGLIILALAEPVLNPREAAVAGGGPLAIVMDNGWSTAPDWQARVEAAEGLIDDAERAEVPVALVFTANATQNATPTSPADARERLGAAGPVPLHGDRARAIGALEAALDGQPPATLAFLTDNIAPLDGADDVAERLASFGAARLLVVSGNGATLAVTDADNAADALRLDATRLGTSEAERYGLTAHDVRGRPIANGTLEFEPGESAGSGRIDAPFELRNDFARISVDGVGSAGTTYLLDDSFRRRRVALFSGEPVDLSQPLLSPLYYIERALEPYADLIRPDDPELSVSLPAVLEMRPSVIVMADIGRLPDDVYEPMTRWIENGGTLLRFAGPRLAGAEADDPLVPVVLRQGERALGGALSWSQPQSLAPYPAESPFAGMAPPGDITVTRQVLAEPSAELARNTWASLEDGTPLVTTRAIGDGRIVLFHVTAEATWSNLPISGDFVEMLRRTVLLSNATGADGTSGAAGGQADEAQSLPPYRILDADGVLVQPAGEARPLAAAGGNAQAVSFDNPPGLYGTEDGFVALNLMRADDALAPLDLSFDGVPVTRLTYATDDSVSLKPVLFGLAMVLLLVDSLIVLFMAGAFSRMGRSLARGRGATAALAALFALVLLPGQAEAADERPGDEAFIEQLDTTHIAYVLTGEDDVDRVSERGLFGLSQFLTYRTSLEPGEPTGLDIERDQLAFYPLIYWPISATAPMPSDQAISRIDAYMKSGGTVLFDTRDQFSDLGGGAASAETERLRAILANLDIPPLEPVPEDHVLTKAFYLLPDFPGRYRGGEMWIEQMSDASRDAERSVVSADGVSSVIITGNDLAGAWAIDENQVPMFPTVPADPAQREYAYRVGVNVMMYMLTGNYKTDQVHVPALLERLGQ
jgi:hypothetical protein